MTPMPRHHGAGLIWVVLELESIDVDGLAWLGSHAFESSHQAKTLQFSMEMPDGLFIVEIGHSGHADDGTTFDTEAVGCFFHCIFKEK